MIYLVSNQINNVTFAQTMPANFTFSLKDVQNREVLNTNAVNASVVNTRTRVKLPEMHTGEYVYTLIYEGYELERGIAVVTDNKTRNLKTYGTTNKYKAYKSDAGVPPND